MKGRSMKRQQMASVTSAARAFIPCDLEDQLRLLGMILTPNGLKRFANSYPMFPYPRMKTFIRNQRPEKYRNKD